MLRPNDVFLPQLQGFSKSDRYENLVFPHQLSEVFPPRSGYVYGMVSGEFHWKLERLPNRRLQFCGHLGHVCAIRSHQEDVGEVPVLGTRNATRGGFTLSGLRGWRGFCEKYNRFEGPRDVFGGSHKWVQQMGPNNKPNRQVTVQIQYKSCY